MARPTNRESLIKSQRDKVIKIMVKKGYPIIYVAIFFNISKGTASKIANEQSKNKGRKKQNGPLS